MDIFIKDNEIINVKYGNCLIKVARNFCYEEASLLRNEKYNSLLDITKNLSRKNRYISSVKNSHDVVCYLMILMNYYCATEMLKHKTGIFRSTIMKRECTVPDSLPEDVAKYIKIWNSASGQYIDGTLVTNSDTRSVRHELLDMDAYIHITSPIRRLVDLLNMIKLQQVLGLATLSESASDFFMSWIQKIDYINVTMRAIRRVQNDCILLDTSAKNISILDSIYDGYCFDKLARNDGLFQYIVYLPELKMTSKITVREDMENYAARKYKLFLFNNEEKFKRKIRLQIVSSI
jgi:hypothetical protein